MKILIEPNKFITVDNFQVSLQIDLSIRMCKKKTDSIQNILSSHSEFTILFVYLVRPKWSYL
jgi:hypothetical protein